MAGEKRKGLSIGVEDIREIIDKNGYLVDKTRMIQALLESNEKVLLFTRPRRFGKTLNQSMFRRFFEDERTEKGEAVDNRYIFDGLDISRCGDAVLQHQQQYPVISISLKSAKQNTWKLAYGELKKRISEEFKRHKYVLEGTILSEHEKQTYAAVMCVEDADQLYVDALRFLSECLSRFHGQKTIILIDEYDVPLENSYFRGFYDEMIGFIRSLFESALKTNPYLERGVITGCLRISRESIFTGLNNMVIDSVLNTRFGWGFGFTEDEVCALLAYYGQRENFAEVKNWYDGYRFGDCEIYNPWSILNYVHDHATGRAGYPVTYWSNTSSNSIIRRLVRNSDKKTRDEIEMLINGLSVEKPVHEDITYGDMEDSQNNLWNFLYFTGYLKAVKETFLNDQLYLSLAIPNRELKSIYRNTVRDWFDDSMKEQDFSALRKALEAGDCGAAGDILSEKLMDTISYYDYDESFYHGFLAGLLNSMGGYSVLSNRESGEGRPDIILKEQKFCGKAMILELKVADNIRQMEQQCLSALRQIEEKCYEEHISAEEHSQVLKYGICFYKKGCRVMRA